MAASSVQTPRVQFSKMKNKCGIDTRCFSNNPLKDTKDFFRFLKCASESEDPDLSSLKLSILLGLKTYITSPFKDHLDTSYKYCNYLYSNIYVTFLENYVSSSKTSINSNKINNYLFYYNRVIDNLHLKLLDIKSSLKQFKNTPDDIFIYTIKKLGVLFLVLEYADLLSSYGTCGSAGSSSSSILDKINQRLGIDANGDFYDVGEKISTCGDYRYKLPEDVFGPHFENYKYGCNCVCNTTFVMSFFRILAKNSRVGNNTNAISINDIQNINAYALNGQHAGHTFLAIKMNSSEKTMDPVHFNKKNYMYIECTLSWKKYHGTLMDMLSSHNYDQFKNTIVEYLFNTLYFSNENYGTYKNIMYIMNPDKIYANTIYNYIAEHNKKGLHDLYDAWPEIFDNNYLLKNDKLIFNVLQHAKNGDISGVFNIFIEILNIILIFPNVKSIWMQFGRVIDIAVDPTIFLFMYSMKPDVIANVRSLVSQIYSFLRPDAKIDPIADKLRIYA